MSRPAATRLAACALGASLVTGCLPVPDPPPPPPTPMPPGGVVVGQGGLAGLEVGRSGPPDVSVAELEAALGVEGELVLTVQSEHCGLAALESAGLAAVTDDHLAVLAYVLERGDARTEEGVGVGSTVEEVLATYADRAVVLEGSSITGGPVVVVRDLEQPDADPEDMLTYGFDTDPGGTVTRVRAGRWPWTANAAYCGDSAPRAEATGWPLG